MRLLLALLLTSSFLSCNKVRETIYSNLDLTDTIDIDDYRTVVDEKNRRGYITKDKEIMQGTYAIKKDDVLIESLEIDGGFLSGRQIYFYKNGQPESILHYSNSIKNGVETNFYENGVIRSTRTYRNGEELNDEIKYNNDGLISSKEETIKGILYTHMYENGKRRITTFLKDIGTKRYNMVYFYTPFETINLVMGTVDGEKGVFYIFDTQFELIEKVNSALNPERMEFYAQQMRV
ncbi:MAG: toxin-antitoxin system YwqK family antitoxin [Patiriisocius sp.]|uniref:toxin-antitoxin system YwqK family antitoxin n=1 Tax=Patiriisocius sp. TaxID=2822396 RepID=UPI003EF69835